MGCARCGADNPATNRFCHQCGSALLSRCPACEVETAPDARFCGQCGTSLDPGAPSDADSTTVPAPRPQAERRHVSVLFVDLVGFTRLSEDRDPEAVRELLSTYFDQARTVVGRYGGTIEKFIGDAVMAVWGTPLTREDDAERAVRAGLDLVEAVALLGEQVAFAGLQARGGVVTGEAAVRLDAVDQGMVAGDVVNTAARVQSLAAPGRVLVDDATREASSRAIAYVDAGSHELKGKQEPVRVFTALQVVAGSGGSQRFDGLEPPFLGRERDLRLLKELLHDTVEQSRAQLVMVTGAAGLGKSRLGWEFFKYVDAIEQLLLWHTGRCLSYGEGVAYWALAEMVRMRFRIAEGDSEGEVRRKLDDGLHEYVADASDREWLRPRLAVLLGVGPVTASTLDRDSLFAGWRLLFERLAERAPVVMVFEDMQDADEGLLDFIDHLLQHAADLPLFVLVLARPELHDRRPAWGHQRNVTLLHLDRLGDERMEAMVGAMVDALPESIRVSLAARAEGVPLFAIETVRMLIDRDIVVPREGRYVLAGHVRELGALDVPPTLQALVAARLDELPESSRRLVRDASILGQSFTRDALEAVVAAARDVAVHDLEALLAELTAREVLTIRADARSPEAGQYRFVQKLMQTVAYQRLSRDDRKVRHLAAAEHLRQSHDAGDIAGMVASHYLGAADARPDAADAPALRATAVQYLRRAGDRARSLAAIEESLRYYERALELSDEDAERAALAEAAGIAAQQAAKFERADEHMAVAAELYTGIGDRTSIARVASWQIETLMDMQRTHEAAALGRRTWAEVGGGSADDGRLAAAIAMLALNVDIGEAPWPWLDRAAEAAEAAEAWDVLGRSLSLKGAALSRDGRPVEGEALTAGAFELARRHGLHYRAAIQALYLGHTALERDLEEGQRWADEATSHARGSGDRFTRAVALDLQVAVQFERGAWASIDVEALHRSWLDALSDGALDHIPETIVPLALYLGDRHLLADGEPLAGLDHPVDETRGSASVRRSLLALEDGRYEEALHAALEGRRRRSMNLLPLSGHVALSVVVDAALALGRPDEVRVALDDGRRGPPTPAAAAHRGWAKARVAAAEDEQRAAEDGFLAAARAFRDLRRPFWVGRVLLDHADWLTGRGESDRARAFASEAHEIFVAVGAAPFAERAARLTGHGIPA